MIPEKMRQNYAFFGRLAAAQWKSVAFFLHSRAKTAQLRKMLLVKIMLLSLPY